jgi:hypothetical protein
MKHTVNNAEPPHASPAFLAVDQITCAATLAGCPQRQAFEVAMLMHVRGVSVDAAVAMPSRPICCRFRGCLRRSRANRA